MTYLTFTLTAAMGACGELAGHERRGTLIWPGRSAVLGLIGAAMGIRRDQSFAQLESLKMAVAVYPDEGLLRDYHTFETVTSVVKSPPSRPAALASGRGVTSITLRDYRQAPLFAVALWNGPLEEIAAALKRPVFTLYLGRKSCPLAAPVRPVLSDATDPLSALQAVDLPPWRGGAPVLVAGDDLDGHETDWRQDDVLDRRAWHFGGRAVSVVRMEDG